jgi:hypothetical protein
VRERLSKPVDLCFPISFWNFALVGALWQVTGKKKPSQMTGR